MRTTNKAPSQQRPRNQIVDLGRVDEHLSRPRGATTATTSQSTRRAASRENLKDAVPPLQSPAAETSSCAAPSGTDYSSFGNEALDRAGDQLHGIHNATLAELFSIGVEKERRGLLSQDGARDLAGWFTLRFGLSFRTGAKWAEAATGLKDLPHLRDGFASGEVSLDKTLAAARFATPETDAMVAREIRHMNAAQVELTARRSKTPTETDEREARSERKVWWRWSDGGTILNLHARLPAAQGARVTAALERTVAQMLRRDDEGDLSLGQRMADGLTALATLQIASDSDPDRANVLVHVDLETLRSGRGAAWTEDGAMFGSHTLGVILCDARLQALIEDDNGKPLGLGRTSRATPVWMRRAVKTRDKCCRFPGCGRTDFLAPHHIDEWIRDEGPTDPDNLVMLCPFHHALVHKADWWIEGEPAGDLVFIGPKGPVRDGPPPLDYDVKKWLWQDLYRPSTEALFDSS